MWELSFIQNWSSSFQSIWRATKAGKIPVRSQLIRSPRCFDSDCSWDLFSYEEAVTTAFIIYCKYNNSRKSGSAGEIKLCDKWFGFFPLTIMIWPELPQLRSWGPTVRGWHLWISPSWPTMYPLLGFFWRQGPEKVHTVSKLENKAYTIKARPQFYTTEVVVTGH